MMKSFYSIFLLQFFLLLQKLVTVESISCFCTEDHCQYGKCESDVCLVGLLKASNTVIRTCGTDEVGCQQNIDKWSDLCACESTLCNTFSFLRANTVRDRGRYNRGDANEDLVFQRIETSHNDFSGYDPDQDSSNQPSKSSLLTLLLVIVPLSVGASTVLVVAFNYYCHLC